jgi:hypothetical protein
MTAENQPLTSAEKVRRDIETLQESIRLLFLDQLRLTPDSTEYAGNVEAISSYLKELKDLRRWIKDASLLTTARASHKHSKKRIADLDEHSRKE